jgi:tetratricopeptide (TPR) repeat protein
MTAAVVVGGVAPVFAQTRSAPPANPGAAYRALVQRYLNGDFSAAAEVAGIELKDARWERDLILNDLLQALARAEDQVEKARSRDRMVRTALAMMLLHTDACLRPGPVQIDDQIGMARSLVGTLDRLTDALSRRFVPPGHLTADDVRGTLQQWYELSALLLAAREGHTLLDFLDRSHGRYPNDPLFRLLYGDFMERFAAGAVVDVSLVKDVYLAEYVRAWRSTLDRARHAYEDALDADPHANEARVRLGRVETLTGDRGAARRNLARALSEATTQRLEFLAALFLGAVAAADGRPGEARADFERAWSVVPGAQSAAFALSQLADMEGDDVSAREWLDRTLQVPFDQRDDPWETYYFGPPPADLAGRLERLRAPLIP